MDISNFINTNNWTDSTKDIDVPFQYLIDWSAVIQKDFNEAVEYIQSMEDVANVIDGYAYEVAHSSGRFKHTIIKRYKL